MPPKSNPIEQVRHTAEQARLAVAARDRAIRMTRKKGHSLRAIAHAAGLSHTAIAKIVAR